MTQHLIMKRTPLITLLVTVVLSSPAGAAQNGGEVWWPQFRGSNSSGLGGGKPPVHFGPGEDLLWRAAVGSGLSSPIVWELSFVLCNRTLSSSKSATRADSRA